MVAENIPRWIAKLDTRKPYVEVVDGTREPVVSPYEIHGQLAVRIGAQFDAWADGRGTVGVEVRYYFHHGGETWSSLLPDVKYTSYARMPPRDGSRRRRRRRPRAPRSPR